MGDYKPFGPSTTKPGLCLGDLVDTGAEKVGNALAT